MCLHKIHRREAQAARKEHEAHAENVRLRKCMCLHKNYRLEAQAARKEHEAHAENVLEPDAPLSEEQRRECSRVSASCSTVDPVSMASTSRFLQVMTRDEVGELLGFLIRIHQTHLREKECKLWHRGSGVLGQHV